MRWRFCYCCKPESMLPCQSIEPDSSLHAASVADRSNAVNAKLQLRRDQIEELSQVWHPN